MRTPEEILKKWSFYGKIPTRELEAIIKEAQKQVWNEVIDEILSHTTEERIPLGYQRTVDGVLAIPIYGTACYFDKDEILKLKK